MPGGFLRGWVKRGNTMMGLQGEPSSGRGFRLAVPLPEAEWQRWYCSEDDTEGRLLRDSFNFCPS